jgi:hypothetical protein
LFVTVVLGGAVRHLPAGATEIEYPQLIQDPRVPQDRRLSRPTAIKTGGSQVRRRFRNLVAARKKRLVRPASRILATLAFSKYRPSHLQWYRTQAILEREEHNTVRPGFKHVLFFAVAGTMVCLSATTATALTAAVAKACDVAAYKAFPNQHFGSKLGVEQRAKFRKDCIARNGVDASSATTTSPPPASPADKGH